MGRVYPNRTVTVSVEYLDLIYFLFIDCFSVNNNFILVIYSFNFNPMYYSMWFPFVSNLHLTLLVRGHASSLRSLLTDKMRWSDTCSRCPKVNFPLLHHYNFPRWNYFGPPWKPRGCLLGWRRQFPSFYQRVITTERFAVIDLWFYHQTWGNWRRSSMLYRYDVIGKQDF